MQSTDILQYINFMKICSKCYEIYGFWKKYYSESINYFSPPKDDELYQKCHFACADFNRKHDMPEKEINQAKWDRHDFNEKVTLCYCCGQELLRSGSRWSVWFCEECKRKVIELNSQFQRTIIPIGRHSLMSGFVIGHDKLHNPEAVEMFLTKVNKMSVRIKQLDNWRARRLSDNFSLLGFKVDISLKKYLQEVSVAIDKSGAFYEMCDYLFGLDFSKDFPQQQKDKEGAAENQKREGNNDDILPHCPDRDFYNKPSDEEWQVTCVEEGDGVEILWISVVIKVRSIIQKYKGGWEGFLQFCKESGYLLYTDNKLVTIASDYPPYLDSLIQSLRENGLQSEHGPVDFYLMETGDPYECYFHTFTRKSQWPDIYIKHKTIKSFDDCEIDLCFKKDSNVAKVRLREGDWNKYRCLYSKAIKLYKFGDVMGSSFECGSVYYRRLSFKEIAGRYVSCGFSTDESDIVDCFTKFISEYEYKDEPHLLYNWVIYHTKHRSLVKYGRTYKEHFLIVSTLQAKNRLTLEKLFELSEDKNSYGNGCLALVYPVYHYAESLNLDMNGRLKLVINFCRLTHAHPQAINAVTLLYAVIDIAMKGGDIFDSREHSVYDEYYSQELKDALRGFLSEHVDLEPKDFIKRYPNNIMALNTLFYALYSLKKADSMEEVVTNVLSFNGDADSVNALALMLWGMINSEKI